MLKVLSLLLLSSLAMTSLFCLSILGTTVCWPRSTVGKLHTSCELSLAHHLFLWIKLYWNTHSLIFTLSAAATAEVRSSKDVAWKLILFTLWFLMEKSCWFLAWLNSEIFMHRVFLAFCKIFTQCSWLSVIIKGWLVVWISFGWGHDLTFSDGRFIFNGSFVSSLSPVFSSNVQRLH